MTNTGARAQGHPPPRSSFECDAEFWNRIVERGTPGVHSDSSQVMSKGDTYASNITERSYHDGSKTAVLLGGMWALLLAIGALIAGGSGHPYWIWIFALIGLFQTGYAYWNSATMALRTMSAYPTSQTQYPQLYAIVHELAGKADQPLPSIWVASTRTSNAFATSRDPQHTAVCCTEGILQILGERELRAIFGRGLVHVYNRDILTSSAATASGGLITSIAQFPMFFGRERRDNNRGGIGVLATLTVALLAPLTASILQFSLSRTREFDTNEDEAHLSDDPLALASALHGLESGTDQVPLTPTPQVQNVSALMTVNPFQDLHNLFSTHPPMSERITRLEKMTGY